MTHLHLLLLLLSFLPPTTSACLPTQTTALLSLKHQLNFTHRSASHLTSWLSTADCCNNWEGVVCSDPRSGLVTALDLSSLSISGTLSPSLFNLTSLISLNLAYNLFDTIPFPESFNLLPNLTHLNLSNAGFAGQIPPGIAGLASLVSLDLSTFYLDEKPNSSLRLRDPDVRKLVKNLHNLRELYLDGVNISADGVEWGGALAVSAPGLRELSLVGCSLSGPIDGSLAELRSLRLLRLDQNRLDCIVPDFLGNFSGLIQLSLSSCGLRGVIPASIFKIRSLTALDVSNNPMLTGFLPEFPINSAMESLVLESTGLYGTLPESIGGLKSLVRLKLMKCRFSGPLPAAIGNLTQLVQLDLSFNNFSGEIPSRLSWWGIVEVVLNNNSFNGSIPVSLGDRRLRSLTKVDLHYNFLTGSIPRTLFSLPSLQVLQLSHNKLSDQLREFLDASRMLSTVDLSNNNLQGEIPSSVFNLSGLKVLELSSNNFSGAIELLQFASFDNLSYLDISNNRLWIQDRVTSESSLHFPKMSTLKLAGCNLTKLPALLRNQTKLSNLDLSNNKISGAIPNWIWGIGGSNLMYLNLSDNLFTIVERPLPDLSITASPIILDLHSNMLEGPIPLPPTYTIVLDYSNNNFTSIIPPNISLYLTVTVFFSLSNNTLTGTIPPSICNAASLNVLDLGLNNFIGSIPQCLIGNLTDLRVLNLAENQLSGTIPNVSSQKCSLQTICLNGNQLGGKLSPTLSKCTMLEVIDLGNNYIRDTFPYWLSSLPQLQVLILRSNQFYGAIGDPEFRMLRVFDLSSNNFDGILSSKCFGSLESMKRGTGSSAMASHHALGFGYLRWFKFYHDAVKLTYKGQEVTLVRSLTVFTYIDLSDNTFQYGIPQVMGELTSLYMLNMSHNSLTGQIPDSLGRLVELESLDLSSNQLAGNIPLDFVDLTFLSVLNLSYNKLWGRIPQGGQLLTFDVSAYEGNEGLCGAPLVKVCSDVVSPSESRIEVVGQPSCEFVVVGVAFGAGLASFFWGLRVCEGARRVFEKKVDRVMWVVVETIGWRQEGAEVSAAEEVEEGERGYCLFCTAVEINEGVMVVRHRECRCPIAGS